MTEFIIIRMKDILISHQDFNATFLNQEKTMYALCSHCVHPPILPCLPGLQCTKRFNVERSDHAKNEILVTRFSIIHSLQLILFQTEGNINQKETYIF